MAPEWDVPGGGAAKAACPLRCRLRYGAASDNPGDQASARDHVDWAGLPINLDLAFSQAQCDKVYAQHLLRKQRAQLRQWLPDGAQRCVCEIAAEAANLDANTDQSAFAR